MSPVSLAPLQEKWAFIPLPLAGAGQLASRHVTMLRVRVMENQIFPLRLSEGRSTPSLLIVSDLELADPPVPTPIILKPNSPTASCNFFGLDFDCCAFDRIIHCPCVQCVLLPHVWRSKMTAMRCRNDRVLKLLGRSCWRRIGGPSHLRWFQLLRDIRASLFPDHVLYYSQKLNRF